MPEIDLSVITVSFNTCDILRETLAAVQRHRGTLRMEQWVVDNASTDGSVGMIRHDFPDALLVVNQENVGPGRARNQVIPRCRGRYILNIDSDVQVHPGTMQALVAYMDEHPDVGAAGCKLLNPDGSYQRSVGNLHHLGPAIRRKIGTIVTRRQREDYSALAEPVNVGWLVGSICIYRQSALEHVGGFDPRFFIYRDDLDLHTRFHQKGWKIAYLPGVAVTHLQGRTADRNFAAARFDYEYGWLLFSRKYGPRWWYWYRRGALLARSYYLTRLASDESLRQRFWGKNPLLLRSVYAELLRASLPGRGLAASSAPPAAVNGIRPSAERETRTR
jgi:N-acetylglucosaminyl-diphospho-decaprenol L-rhamnosyltransferase